MSSELIWKEEFSNAQLSDRQKMLSKKYIVDLTPSERNYLEEITNKGKTGVIQDQLNTHIKASLYKAFPPVEAKRILDKLEFHYTPKHGSW